MSRASWGKRILVVFGVTVVVLGSTYFYLISPHHSSAPPESAEGLLDRADTLAWGNRWADAQPLYARAQHLFDAQKQSSKALYAEVSQVPPDESGSVPGKIFQLTQDLRRPAAQDAETRLRILTIRGMLETNYDAAQARSTWEEVKALALKQRHFELASRAEGEQGIAAFILGDTDTAKKQVVRAWGLSKVEHDPAATVRYASVFGAGLVQLRRYKEALTPLDQAIKIAASNPGLAYPTIAVYAKIEALAGLKRYDSALALANSSLARLQGTLYEQHKSQVYISRGSINRELGDWSAAISDYKQVVTISEKTDNYRGVTDAGGLLAQAYEHTGDLTAALGAINTAIAANTFARESIFEREAVADERAILRDALRRGMGEATYGAIRSEFDRRRDAGDFRSVQGEKYSSGRSFTTPETIAAERANVRHVLDGRNTVTPIMGAEQAREQANTRDFLNDSQRKAIEEILNSSDRIHGLQGLAGTGKTTTLEVIREGAEKNSYTVEGFAPSSKAAGQLREAGIDANTLQSFLARGENHPSANPEIKHLYLLDESSLASTRQMRAFLDKLNPDDRVVVIGDTRQHQGVDAGRPFQQMQEAGMQTSHLDKIMRQKDLELLKAVQHLANNETEKGIAMLAEQGRVSEITNGQERINAIAKDYATRPDNTIIVSPDNKSRQQINEAVRGELLQQGTLADDGQKFSTLAHRSDMTGADRTWAARYNVGEVLQYTSGSKAEGIERDSFATVRSVGARANTLTVELENGSSVTYDPRRLRGVNVFRETEREFATGDRIQFTAPNKDLGLSNRDLGTVLGLEDEKMTVRLDGKAERTVTFDAAEFRQFDHGYAVTSHSSQGLTAGRVIANIDTESSNSLINTRLAYVAISRASEDARIYTNNAETLGERLAADISKTAALDFRQPSSSEQTRLAVEAFRNNDPATATELLQQQGRIYEYANPDHRLAAVALDYAAQPDRAVIVAADPADRRELTQLIRDDLHAQGRLTESRSVSVLVEQQFGNPRLAANYSPGDEIHYRKGSPEEHGIIHNSTATVIAVDISKNLLTVETRSGEQASYNPALLKQQTGQTTVYRAEERDLAVGDRIQFTVPDRENRIHSGDLATVERIGEDNALSVRLDNGKDIELGPEKARHIELGYSVETAKYISADRVLITGESSQLAEQQVAFTKLNPNIHELAIYTSDRTNLLPRDNGIGKEPELSNVELSNDSSLSNGPEPSGPSIVGEGYGIGL